MSRIICHSIKLKMAYACRNMSLKTVVRFMQYLSNCWSHCLDPISVNLFYFSLKNDVTCLPLLFYFKIMFNFVLFVMIFKVRRGELWNVQESMMELTLDISCVYRSQGNQQKKGCATPIHARLCKFGYSFFSRHGMCPLTKAKLNAVTLDSRFLYHLLLLFPSTTEQLS